MTEGEIKIAFVSAYNKLVSERVEIIVNVGVIRQKLCRTDELKKSILKNEMSALAGIVQDAIGENVRIAQDQGEYKELNKNQKDRIKQISARSYTMEWENPELMDYLLGDLPKIRRFQEDKNITSELVKLEKILSTYDSFLSNKVSFLKEVENIIALIQKKKNSW